MKKKVVTGVKRGRRKEKWAGWKEEVRRQEGEAGIEGGAGRRDGERGWREGACLAYGGSPPPTQYERQSKQ